MVGEGWVARHRRVIGLLAVLVVIGLFELVQTEEQVEEPSATEGRAALEEPERPGPNDPRARTSDDPEPRRERSAAPKKRTPEQKRSTGSPRTDRARRQPPPARTFFVSRVVDGDTVELGNGRTVRLVGIDTPEVGRCGADRATAVLEGLVLRRQVRLATSDEDTDGYGRLLRYVDIGAQDAGLRLIKNGVAVARYDSRDGYGAHPRERVYVAADRASRNVRCPGPARSPQPPRRAGTCAAGYTPCIPPYPPDLDCADVDGPVSVTGTDPHGLDDERDGVGCE